MGLGAKTEKGKRNNPSDANLIIHLRGFYGLYLYYGIAFQFSIGRLRYEITNN